MGDFTTDSCEVHQNPHENVESSYSKKLENLEALDKFLDTYNLLKLDIEDINNFNESTMTSKIESMARSLFMIRGPGLKRYIAKFCQTLEK